ncbi:MAG TPA: hypothetical protein VEA41_02545 [Salinarimonas sp.]|nr:hypothetical protein [Salinarimonas sp.]
MPDATTLVSVTDLKAYLQETSSTNDTIITAIRDAVDKIIPKYVGRDILATTYTEYHDGDGSRLHVKHYPIISVTSIEDDTTRVFAGGASTVISSSYYISNDQNSWDAGIVELFNWAFQRGRKNVKIVYVAGWSTIPADLAHAAKLICAKEYKIQSKLLLGEISQSVGDRTVTLDMETFPKQAVQILERYRRIGV